MRRSDVLLVLLMVAPPLAGGCASRRSDLGPEMHVLGTIEDVGASAVGYEGVRHPFHELAHAILYEGTEADFVRLTGDPRPVPRCMGLYLLARSGSPRAATILERHMSDRQTVVVTNGCVGSTMTVGGFARRLLRDRDYLEFVSKPKPIWSPFGILADDVRLLAYDGAPLGPEAEAARDEAARFGNTVEHKYLVADVGEDRSELQPAKSIRAQLDHGVISLDSDTVARLCRDLPRWRVVKALGRAGPHPAVRQFLLGPLRDPDEQPRVRLIAASALTRDPAAEAIVTLGASVAQVNEWAGDLEAGENLLRQSALRVDVDSLLRENEAHREWEFDDPGPVASRVAGEAEAAGYPEEKFAAIEASGDPAVAEWWSRVTEAFEDACNGEPEDREFLWRLRASSKLRLHRAPWDTYSDAVQALTTSGPFGGGLFGAHDGDGDGDGDGDAEVTEQRDRLRANIHEALRALDREPR